MYVTVSVLIGERRIFPWKMFLCSEEHTFGSLFEEIRKDVPETIARVTSCSLSKYIDCIQSACGDRAGIQCIAVLFSEWTVYSVHYRIEKVIHGCNSMKEIRTAAARQPGFKEAYGDSVQPAVCLLMEVINRLKLKDEPVQTQSPCTPQEIDDLWQRIQEVDSTVLTTDTRKEHLKARTQLKAFMSHCCVQRHYFFCIKKCGVAGCKMCMPPRLPCDVFNQLNFFPDPEKKPASDSYQ